MRMQLRSSIVSAAGLRLLGVALALAALLPSAAGAQKPAQTKQAPTAEATVTALEHQVLDALKAGDVTAIDRLGWVGTTMIDPSGVSRLTRNALEGFFKSCTTKALDLSDEKTTSPAPNVVLLTYKATADQTCGGVRQPPVVNALTVYQRQGGRWTPIAHTETPPAAAPQPAGTPTAEQLVTRLRSQWWAFVMASLANARAHGQSPAELGASVGRMFASTWGQNVTPQVLGRGMRANYRLAGVDAELLEDTPEKAVLRYGQPDAAAFAKQFGEWGVTGEDFKAMMVPLVQAIATAHGLAWDVRPDGDHFVATVTRKP